MELGSSVGNYEAVSGSEPVGRETKEYSEADHLSQLDSVPGSR